jgi:hypothetical protein
MVSFFSVIEEISIGIVDAIYEREYSRAEAERIRLREKEQRRAEKKRMEHERWAKATEESLRNPDEWEILPYGWSPFGIFI